MGQLLLPGDAGFADVLAGKKFSAGSNYGATGTMPENGSPIWTPNTADQAIAAGHYTGGTVKGDPNLVTGNIRSGVTMFGVAGKASVVDTASATAGAGDILTGKSAFINGASVAGSMPNRNADQAALSMSQSGTTIGLKAPSGYYDGTRNINYTEPNLLAANIKSGVSIFGVTGGFAGVLKAKITGASFSGSSTVKSYTVTGLNFTPVFLIILYNGSISSNGGGNTIQVVGTATTDSTNYEAMSVNQLYVNNNIVAFNVSMGSVAFGTCVATYSVTNGISPSIGSVADIIVFGN